MVALRSSHKSVNKGQKCYLLNFSFEIYDTQRPLFWQKLITNLSWYAQRRMSSCFLLIYTRRNKLLSFDKTLLRHRIVFLRKDGTLKKLKCPKFILCRWHKLISPYSQVVDTSHNTKINIVNIFYPRLRYPWTKNITVVENSVHFSPKETFNNI